MKGRLGRAKSLIREILAIQKADIICGSDGQRGTRELEERRNGIKPCQGEMTVRCFQRRGRRENMVQIKSTFPGYPPPGNVLHYARIA